MMCIIRNSQIAKFLMKNFISGKKKTFNVEELKELSEAGLRGAKAGRRIRKAFISEREKL